MNKQEIKKMKREIALRPIKRFFRLYWKECQEIILGAVLIPVGAWWLFVGTWAVF